MANVGPPLNLSFGGTAELEIRFLPEPGAALLLGLGWATLLALRLSARRGRARG